MSEEERLAREVERLKRELEALKAVEPAETPPTAADEPEAPESEQQPAAEPTPEDLARVETLLREAQLAKIRGQKDEFQAKLQMAAELAPGKSEVHEALGDAHADGRRTIAAKECYQRAVKANPKNASAERKLAELVFRETQAELMASGYFTESSEALTSAKKASLFNVVLPGFGHILIGNTVRGVVLVCLWVLCLILSFTMGGVSGFLSIVGLDRNATANPAGFVPVVLAAVVFAVSFVGLSAKAPSAARKGRPEPPVNLRY